MLAPNITSQKVAIPSILFLALSPGMLLKTNGMKLSFKTGTDTSSVFFHGLVFFLAYSMIAKCMGLILTQNDLLVATSLFMALSPGLLLTIPPGQFPVRHYRSHYCLRACLRYFTKAISSVLLSDRTWNTLLSVHHLWVYLPLWDV